MKSKCAHIRQLLSEYIDGALDSPRAAAVMKHMEGCEDCRREYASLESLIRRLGDIGAVNAPEDFLEKFHDRIRNVSIYDRIRELLSSVRIRVPVEIAAFATTAVLILSFFSFFPAEEKNNIKTIEGGNMAAMDEGTLPSQNFFEQHQAENPSKGMPSATRVPERDIPVKLALTLTAREESTPIPSQSVSFGSPDGGYTGEDLDLWRSEDGNDSATRLIQPDEVNKKIEEILRAVKGKEVSRSADAETGYPGALTLEIPAGNYSRFISRIGDLGELKSAAPALTEGSEGAEILIQMELTLPE